MRHRDDQRGFGIVMATLPRSRAGRYGLIFLACAAAMAGIDVVGHLPSAWQPAGWLYVRLLTLPGLVLLVATGADPGFASYWIDGPIVILGSATFWFVVTIAVMAVWSARNALIFLAWVAVVGCVDTVDHVDFAWRPVVWPYTGLLRFLEFPGIVLMVSTGAIHGFGYYWIDSSIVILGSAIFWFLVTIAVVGLWSVVIRRLNVLGRRQ
jgi:hypothetical protein